PIIRIAPTHRPARRASLPGIHFGLLGQLAIALIERAADLIANDAADHGASHGAQRLAAALAELVADHTTGDGANGRAPFLLGPARRHREGERHNKHRSERGTSHNESPWERLLLRQSPVSYRKASEGAESLMAYSHFDSGESAAFGPRARLYWLQVA